MATGSLAGFSALLDKVKREVISLLARVRLRDEAEVAAAEAEERARAEASARQMQFQHAETGGLGADEEAAQVEFEQALASGEAFNRIGRNDPCPCGSGKKFKHCHGQLA